ncbi:MAG: DUF192 domain-containing protein [Alkalispirochaetaceae bacterium]
MAPWARMLPLLILVVLFTVGCGEAGAEEYELRLRDRTLEVELADTPEARSRGLMFRESLGEDKGMLFVFREDRRRSFWMKDTLIPLSIAYISSEWIILEIYDMEPRSLDAVPSRNPVRYALEVNQGYFEEAGITPGSRVYPSEELLDRIESSP